jgi:formiminotetrahydrofolate cyclodeaminase
MTTAASTVAELVDALGARTPTPACGTGAAVVGAIGAALAELAARVSDDEDAAERARSLGAHLLELADADAEAYRAFLDSRNDADLQRTIDVPRAIAEAAREVCALAADLVAHGKRSVVGDAEAAVALAVAAERIGSRLVELNQPQ